MLRATLKGLLAHKLRLLLSAVAVVLGVAFVAGSLVFTSTLSRTFHDLFESVSADVTVTRATSFDQGLINSSTSAADFGVPASVLRTVKGVSGVAAADGDIQAEGVYVVDKDGKAIGGTGAPGIGIGWSGTPGLSVTTITSGRPPAAAGEVAIDRTTAEKGGFVVGDTTSVLTPKGAQDEKIVGIFKFGKTGGLAGASLTAFDPATAQQLLGAPGVYSSVSVKASDGVSEETLKQRISAALPSGYDVKTKSQQVDENSKALESSLKFINIFLLVFAGIALFVGSFIILNTFSMIVAQRSRELALLRAIGASRGQVTRSVLGEASVVGLIGATVGLGLGVALAAGLKALFGAIGLELTSSLALPASAIIWSYVVGVLVTLGAAYLPARRAAKVPPVAAMRDDVAMPERSLRVRLVVGSALAGIGVLAMLGGTLTSSGGTAATLVGLGALALIGGAIALSPVLSRPALRLIAGWFHKPWGTVGRLAEENARRNPRRTAATASALMIGLALVTSMSILGASTGASVDQLVNKVFGADFSISNNAGTPFSPDVAARARQVPGVAQVAQERFGQAKVGGTTEGIAAIEPDALGSLISVTFRSGSADGLAGDGLLVAEKTATERGWSVGSKVPVTFPFGGSTVLTVGGIYDDDASAALQSYVVSLDTFSKAGYAQQDRFVYVGVDQGADLATVRSGLQKVVDAFPIVQLQDQAEFKDSQRASINQLLYVIYALLALAVLIAVLGIVNTLALSVIERTREIGLLRAVGMVRPQLRRMVRLESVAIAVYGALLGVVLGLVFGVALQRALSGQGIQVLSVPVGRLVVFLVLAAVVGVLAAVWPARRAARLDVLRAITTE